VRFGILPVQQVETFSESLEQAIFAEELGYDSVWLFEHHGVERADGGSHYFSSPLIALAAIAAVTERIRLGTGIVILPLLPPVRVAEDALLVQAISGGRLVLGVGAGYRPEEFAAFGVPFEERAARMEESLHVLRRLFSETRVTHRGTFFALDDVTIVGAPDLSPPPLWGGGWAPGAVRRIARHCEGWIGGLTGDVEKLASCIATYLGELEKLDSAKEAPAALALEREVFVGGTVEELDEARAALHALYAEEHLAWRHPNVPSSPPKSFDALAADRFVVGTPDEVEAELRRYANLGVTDLLCRMHYPGLPNELARSSMELFAREVMPAFAQASPSPVRQGARA